MSKIIVSHGTKTVVLAFVLRPAGKRKQWIQGKRFDAKNEHDAHEKKPMKGKWVKIFNCPVNTGFVRSSAVPNSMFCSTRICLSYSNVKSTAVGHNWQKSNAVNEFAALSLKREKRERSETH
ncbi:hypothetical protein RUM44_002541 [Polyplax serrata]|uniref:Uncharacterized protein n=1 Tax=Polyplax serrata TaxID=468196 RepID=A0ABR1AF36_POLSC